MTAHKNIANKILAIKNRWIDCVNHKLAMHEIDREQLHILMVVYKDLQVLELYGSHRDADTFKKISTFELTKRSGRLGPKRQEGDKQVPEGFYEIDVFNPDSKYHLSLRLNYPNAFDQSHQYTGSSIYIHGGNESVGCIPVGDTAMEEIYIFASLAKDNGQINIPVYSFPFPMSTEYLSKYSGNPYQEIIPFWKNLQEGYQQFMDTKKKLSIQYLDGKYHFHH
ncbi:L,D-transpeptidase family protein [Sphingobacterium sp. HJSM2_6]|uniref:L,D-transpeptidase family protein n=1 Tax=Sphingobacterium sp. HJSM2_6 TaxID=3366264 RepID=UPI003BCD01F7